MKTQDIDDLVALSNRVLAERDEHSRLQFFKTMLLLANHELQHIRAANPSNWNRIGDSVINSDLER